MSLTTTKKATRKSRMNKQSDDQATIGFYDRKKKRYVCSMRPTISKALLLEAAKLGPKWDYNRQLCDKKIAELPNGRYKIVDTLPHYHAYFQRVPEHRRLMVQMPKGYCFVDVPMSFFGRVVDDSLKAA